MPTDIAFTAPVRFNGDRPASMAVRRDDRGSIVLLCVLTAAAILATIVSVLVASIGDAIEAISAVTGP